MIISENGVPSNSVCLETPWANAEENCEDENFITDLDCQNFAYKSIFANFKYFDQIEGMFLFHIDIKTNSDYYGNN